MLFFIHFTTQNGLGTLYRQKCNLITQNIACTTAFLFRISFCLLGNPSRLY